MFGQIVLTTEEPGLTKYPLLITNVLMKPFLAEFLKLLRTSPFLDQVVHVQLYILKALIHRCSFTSNYDV